MARWRVCPCRLSICGLVVRDNIQRPDCLIGTPTRLVEGELPNPSS